MFSQTEFSTWVAEFFYFFTIRYIVPPIITLVKITITPVWIFEDI
nr:MAG TPA: hypothetical protein [Caudoviricetes sp.]